MRYEGLPMAIDVALYLYRFRVTIALIYGHTRQRVMGIQPPSASLFIVLREGGFSEPLFNSRFGEYYAERLWSASVSLIYIDAVLIWISIIWALARQLRLCCKLGCCRYVSFCTSPQRTRHLAVLSPGLSSSSCWKCFLWKRP